MIVEYRMLDTSGDTLSWEALDSFQVGAFGTAVPDDLPGDVLLGCWGGQIAVVPFGYIPTCA